MSILRVEGLYKTYGEKVLFDDISFVINRRDKIGVIGVNGTGKSTLLKTLAGVENVEKGEIIHANDFRMEFLPQEPSLVEKKSLLDQIYAGDSPKMKAMREYERAVQRLENDPEDEALQKELIQAQERMDQEDAWEANTIAKQVLTRLGIVDFSKQVKELSGGQKKRVAIARALIQPADLLIMDEPTNHLDSASIEWLESYLADYQGAVILVTHDRYFLNRVTNRIYELAHGNLYVYEGNYELFLEKKAEREMLAERAEAKRKNILRTELEWLRRSPRARGTKQKARVERVERLQQTKSSMKKEDIEFSIGSVRLGKKVIEMKNVTKSYHGEVVIPSFSYIVSPKERLGMIGPNGSGKTTLLQLFSGNVTPDNGEIEIGETVRIGYYSQENEELDENKRVIEYIREIAEVVRTVDGNVVTAEQMLERFLFERPSQWNYIYRLSGGEKRRLYLLSILMKEPNVLLLDEPTNDLDTETLSVLEKYLEDFPGAVITVSHDRYFLDRVVQKLLVFEPRRSIQTFQGNYSDYIETKAEEREQVSNNKKAEKKPTPTKRRPRKKLSYKEQKEWEGIEDRITALEQKLEEIEQQIIQAGSDYEQVKEWTEKQQQVSEELEQAIERWTELSLLIEE